MFDDQNELVRAGRLALGSWLQSLAGIDRGNPAIPAPPALDGGGDFRNAALAFERVCARYRWLGATGLVGEFAFDGETVPVHALNVGGRLALIGGDPLRLPPETLHGRLATYLLLRTGANPVGAWTAREAAGQIDLDFVARVPMPVATVDNLAQAIAVVGNERINLQKMLAR